MRLRVARGLCSPMPPLLSQKVRDFIYPYPVARQESYSFTTVRARLDLPVIR
jgi:hypothetical protein